MEVERKEIFFMPTWRNWIKLENARIEDTEYFKNITGLITDERFNKYLEEKNLYLNVYIHQLMHDYLKDFNKVKLGKKCHSITKRC